MSGNSYLLSFAGWNVSLDWTDEEQRTLEQCMVRYAQLDPLPRYIRIASALPRKSVRDIALRARWTSLQHQVQKHSNMDTPHFAMPKMTSKPMLPTKTSSMQGVAYGRQQTQPKTVQATSNEGPPTIEGPIAHLLDSNLAILNQFRANMAAFKVQDNTRLLVQFRENIINILNLMESMGGVMSHMPQLPVRMNVDLANNFLPSRPAALSYDDLVMPPPPQPSLNAPGMVPLSNFASGGNQSQHFHNLDVRQNELQRVGNEEYAKEHREERVSNRGQDIVNTQSHGNTSSQFRNEGQVGQNQAYISSS